MKESSTTSALKIILNPYATALAGLIAVALGTVAVRDSLRARDKDNEALNSQTNSAYTSQVKEIKSGMDKLQAEIDGLHNETVELRKSVDALSVRVNKTPKKNSHPGKPEGAQTGK